MLTLSESLTDTVTLMVQTSTEVTCDVSISEALSEVYPNVVFNLFEWAKGILPPLWQALIAEIPENHWIQQFLAGQSGLNFSLILVTNQDIQALNREFRQKDAATDVLTFTLLDDAQFEGGLTDLPELSLGEIYVSLPWAIQETQPKEEEIFQNTLNFSSGLTLYLMTRMIHGSLHLLGVHHDTMPAYNKVVAIQRSVLNAVATTPD